MFLRKKRYLSTYISYESIDKAMSDTNSYLDKEIFEAELTSRGEITVVMMPVKVMRDKDISSVHNRPKKKYADCEDDDYNEILSSPPDQL